jgi:hypothetical protein
MKNRMYAWHLFGRSRVDFLNFAIRDRRLDRNRVQQSGEMKIGSVLRDATHLQRPVDARSIAADR